MKLYFEFSFVIIFIYLIPLFLFIKYSRKYLKNYLISIITIIYIALSVVTINFNFMPLVIVILTLYYLKKDSFLKESDYEKYNFSLKRFDSVEGIKLAGITLLITIIVSLLVQTIFKALNIPMDEQDIIKALREIELWKFMVLAVSGLIVAPIIEEFIFRWFFFEKLLRGRINIVVAGIISSLIFAVGHLSLVGFFSIFVLAMINCYVIEKYGYWYAVFNHFFFNFLSFFAIFIQRFFPGMIK